MCFLQALAGPWKKINSEWWSWAKLFFTSTRFFYAQTSPFFVDAMMDFRANFKMRWGKVGLMSWREIWWSKIKVRWHKVRWDQGKRVIIRWDEVRWGMMRWGDIRRSEMMRDGVRLVNLRWEGVRYFLRIRREKLSRLLSVEATIASRQCSKFSSTRSGCPPSITLLATDQWIPQSKSQTQELLSNRSLWISYVSSRMFSLQHEIQEQRKQRDCSF